MKTKTISPLGLSITGAGPKIMRPMILFLIIGIVVQFLFPSVVSLPLLTESTLKNAGWVLTISGAFFWVWAVVQFTIGFPRGKLITTGVYSLSRNPIYASWIVFILPGLAGICNNWIFFVSAIAMFIALKIYITAEEKQMLEHFGDSYKEYTKKVNRII